MRRILACLLVLSMMLAFSACQNTKPAGTPDEPSVPAEPVEPVQPDEPAQPDTPEQPSEPDAPETPEEPSVRCLPLSYQTNRYYGMFDEGMKKKDLCAHFGRTPGAIESRLQRLGKM